MTRVYHVTTPRRHAQYVASGRIIAPVRFWLDEQSARRWMQRTLRSVLLSFERPEPWHPLPDHGNSGFAPRDVMLAALRVEEGLVPEESWPEWARIALAHDWRPPRGWQPRVDKSGERREEE